MPTGYTAPVEDGTISDLKSFALRCARAMGACVMMRDVSLDVPPPREGFTASDFHATELKKAQEELARLEALPLEVLAAEFEQDHVRRLQSWRESNALAEQTVGRYKSMLAQVEAWTPPTPEHEGLKAFMLEQLRESMERDPPSDAGPFFPEGADAFVRDAKAQRIQKAQRSIAYHTKAHADEVERTTACNRWIADLYASLESNNGEDG